MQSVAAAIDERVEELRQLLREFLLQHSGNLRDINDRGRHRLRRSAYACGNINEGADANHGYSTNTGPWRPLSARF